MLKFYLSFIIVLIISTHAFALDSVRIYPNARALTKNDPVIVNGISIRKVRAKDKGLSDYIIKSAKYNIQSDALALELNDSLYLNCWFLLKIRSYALAEFRTLKHIYFRASQAHIWGLPGKSRAPDNDVTAAYLLGGVAVGSMVKAHKTQKKNSKRFDYLYNYQTGEVLYLSRTAMRRLIQESNLLQDDSMVEFLRELLKKRTEESDELPEN